MVPEVVSESVRGQVTVEELLEDGVVGGEDGEVGKAVEFGGEVGEGEEAVEVFEGRMKAKEGRGREMSGGERRGEDGEEEGEEEERHSGGRAGEEKRRGRGVGKYKEPPLAAALEAL